MAVHINFHGKNILSSSRLFADSENPFATFEMSGDGNNIVVYINDVETAERILLAAQLAVENARDIELEREIKDALLMTPENNYQSLTREEAEEALRNMFIQ